ncbi:KUP/HAK/KT family potassium transporter [Thetidibacter halocola]|uniref:KUP/HAK/KT family potassium transporter n=1 Tax=Thetidibacter halocola TaxID=2827239 RepID=UPI003D161B97
MLLDRFISQIERGPALHAPGTAFYLTSDANATPPALPHNLRHNHVRHQQIIVLTVETVDVPPPRVAEADRSRIERLSDRFFRVSQRFDSMDTPNGNAR